MLGAHYNKNKDRGIRVIFTVDNEHGIATFVDYIGQLDDRLNIAPRW